jgi:hypothetical protein
LTYAWSRDQKGQPHRKPEHPIRPDPLDATESIAPVGSKR